MERKEFEYLQRITKYIEKYELLKNDDSVVIGLSGGADSVALLRILVLLREKMNLKLHAIHVHHGIRDVSADRDEVFCRDICNELLVDFEAVHVDIPSISGESGESIEECARRIRYEILRKYAERNSNAKIAVAHHMDDQAETVLFRIIRGTGIKGLAAMRPVNNNIIRPLLCMSRDEILDYLGIYNQKYCLDETNGDDSYSRNKIRLHMLPYAREICPETITHITNLSEEAAMVSEFLDKCAHEIKEAAKVNVKTYKTSTLAKADKIVVLLAIRKMIEQLTHSLKDITREHVESIYRLINEAEYKEICLPKGLKVSKEGDFLRFSMLDDNLTDADCEKCELNEEINIGKSIVLPRGYELLATFDSVDISKGVSQCLYTKWLDYDKINPGLCVRFRQEGDFLIVDDKGTKKSLSRYMIDEKIPKSEREYIPVVACGSEIVWVIGYRISAHCKVSNNTKTIIKLEVKGEGYEGEH